MGIIISIGKWGGLYAHFNRAAWRVCLGFVALTITWFDADYLINAASVGLDALAARREAQK